MQGGSDGPEHNAPGDRSDRAFHQLGMAFLDDAQRPRSPDDVKSLMGRDYEVLPHRVKESLEAMDEAELTEVARLAGWMRDKDLVFDLPGGKVCFL